MTTFSRDAVYLKWNGGTTIRAFKVKREGYRGGNEDKPASYDRSLADGSMLRVYAPTTPRQFLAIVLGEDSPSGATGGVTYGSIAELKAAWAATDLQCQGFEDSGYWNAEWRGPWPATPIDPVRKYADIPMMLEGRD